MKKSMIAIVSASIAVAIAAVTVLVLFLTGVFSIGSNKTEADKWRDAAKEAPQNSGMLPFEVFEYLGESGHFELGDTYESQYCTSYYYEYHFTLSDSRKCIAYKSVSEWTDDTIPDNSRYSFMVMNEDGAESASLSNPDWNESPKDMEVYVTFLEWCDYVGLTPEQIIQTLDYYQEQVEREPYDLLCATGVFEAEFEDDVNFAIYTYTYAPGGDKTYVLYKIPETSTLNSSAYYGFHSHGSGNKDPKAYINEEKLSLNTAPEDKAMYQTFIDWCGEIGLTPQQVMQALDYYQKQIEPQ